MPYPRIEVALSEVEKQQVLDALDAVLNTEKFLAAPQMSAFLRYVVEQSVDGNQNRIKAFTVAVDALGKPETFDPQNDPVVRVLAGRLRSSLNNYYEDHPTASPRIKMKRGTYVPFFEMDKCLPPFSDTSISLHTENNSSQDDTAQVNAAQVNAAQTNAARQADDAPTLTTANKPSALLLQERAGHGDNSTQPYTTATAAHSWLITLLGSFKILPTSIVFLTVVFTLAGAVYQIRKSENVDASLSTQSLTGNTPFAALGLRARPEQLSLFISAIARGSSLQQSMSTAVSSALSESDEVRIHRILEKSQPTTFWPEDYILSLDVMTLKTEVRVSMQLMEAQTGRLIYSEDVQLAAKAMTDLTPDDLCVVISAALKMIEKEGPLFDDYKLKNESHPFIAIETPVH